MESIPGPHTRLKIRAQGGRYDNSLPLWFLAPIDSLKIPALLIPYNRNIKANRTLVIQELKKIEANSAYSTNRQDRSENNELDLSKTNRGGYF